MGPPTDAVDTDHGTVWLQDGILFERVKPVVGTVAMAEERFKVFRDLTGDTPTPLLFDIRDWMGGEAEAWVSSIKNTPLAFTAVAVLANKETAPLVGRFPEIISRLMVPVELFTEEDTAVAFLRGFVAPD